MASAGGTGAAPDGGISLPMAGTTGGPSTSGAGGGSAGGAGGSGPIQPVMQTCPATSMLRPGESTQTIQIGGVMRSYILHVPASYTGQTPVPLVLDWHGILLSSSLQRSVSGFAALSDSQGFIVAFPEGTDTAFNIGKCCTSSSTVDDLGFAKGLVTKLSQQGCIDLKRVHSVGYSMGGGMSMFLACNASDVFASIATSAFDLQPEVDEPCKPSRPISVIDFRSTADPIVAYAGAKDTIPPNGTPTLVTFIGAEATLMKWGALNGCMGSPQPQANGCQTYAQCNAGTEVTLCTKQGGGHDLMDPAPAWEFLKRHPMP
jgi:polyhydroxybutyrate depolymerase